MVGDVWFDVVEKGFNTFVKLVAEFSFLVIKTHTRGRHLKMRFDNKKFAQNP
jgi:hypothetical protein